MKKYMLLFIAVFISAQAVYCAEIKIITAESAVEMAVNNNLTIRSEDYSLSVKKKKP